MQHALLVTQGTGGDIIPFLGIGTALKRRGYMVTVLTHHGYAALVRQSGLDFLAMDSASEYAAFIADGALLNDLRGIPTFFQRHLLPKVLEHCALIQRHYGGVRPVIVARHLADVVGRIAAEQIGAPLVRVFTAPAQAATMPVLAAICRDILAPDITHVRASLGLPPIQNWERWAAGPPCSLALWPEWFAAPTSAWPPGVLPVGFMRHTAVEDGELPPALQAFLEGAPPPVLITGSTGTFTIDGFYPASIEACHLLGRRGIVVSRQRQPIPAYLSDQIQWFEQAPFASLILRMGAIVHHGGMGTVAHALAAGIPQVVLAHGGDRPDVGARVQQLGVGISLEPQQCTPTAIAAALQRLLLVPQVRERCADYAQRLQRSDAAARAGELIDTYVRTGVPVPDWQAQVGVEAVVPDTTSGSEGRLQERAVNEVLDRQALLARIVRERRAANERR